MLRLVRPVFALFVATIVAARGFFIVDIIRGKHGDFLWYEAAGVSAICVAASLLGLSLAWQVRDWILGGRPRPSYLNAFGNFFIFYLLEYATHNPFFGGLPAMVAETTLLIVILLLPLYLVVADFYSSGSLVCSQICDAAYRFVR